MSENKDYSPEFRERAVRLLLAHQDEYPSPWAAIRSMARKIGCSAETLHKWVTSTEVDEGNYPGVSSPEQARIRELERENRELKQANERLSKPRLFSRKRNPT